MAWTVEETPDTDWTVTPSELVRELDEEPCSVLATESAAPPLPTTMVAVTVTLEADTLRMMSALVSPLPRRAARLALNAAWSNDSTLPATENVLRTTRR